MVSDGLFAEPPIAPAIWFPIKSPNLLGDDASNAAPLGGLIKPLLSILIFSDLPYRSFFWSLNKSNIVGIYGYLFSINIFYKNYLLNTSVNTGKSSNTIIFSSSTI